MSYIQEHVTVYQIHEDLKDPECVWCLLKSGRLEEDWITNVWTYSEINKLDIRVQVCGSCAMETQMVTEEWFIEEAKRWRNRQLREELNTAGGVSTGGLDMPDGEERWNPYYDNSLTTIPSTMLNTGEGSSTNDDGSSTSLQAANPSPLPTTSASPLPPSSSLGLICEYYKGIPLDKLNKTLVDKQSSLPHWTTIDENGQICSDENGIPVSLLQSLPLNRLITDSNEETSQDVDIYLNSGLEKHEKTNEGKTCSVINTHKSSISILKNRNPVEVLKDDVNSENQEAPLEPLPMIVQVKSEQKHLAESHCLSQSPSPPTTGTRDLPPVSSVIAQTYSSHILPQGYDTLAAQFTSSASPQFQNPATTSVYMIAAPPEYRGLQDYYTEQQLRQNLASTLPADLSDSRNDTAAFVDRYIRQTTGYKGSLHGISVDLSSPDSGIGETTIASREPSALPPVSEIFDYSELSQAQALLQSDPVPSRPASTTSGSSRRSWNEYGRNSEFDRVMIPKLHSDLGFKYYLESPISTSQRREDDRITYINKGQFYGITLEYIPDHAKPLKSTTVKSVVILMFREEKPADEELKAWQFWHSRQHSVKQRILDADTKNSTGIVGQIEEVTHNAIAFYWNPLEAPAKVNIAVQCLSTDFSNQKGVKGLPLHLQIDTFDEFKDGASPHHRGYCQIKVFCDKGAERKTRDEERRAAKRKLNSTNAADSNVTFPGRKKVEELYHLPCDRSEFYSMSDLLKPPILFTPCDDVDKISMDLSFYSNNSALLEDHNLTSSEKHDSDDSTSFTPPPKKPKLYPADRVLIYCRPSTEDVFQPLHIDPPNLQGLERAIERKYRINGGRVRNFFKKTSKGILVQLDDDLIKHYCNEDVCFIDVTKIDDSTCDITLVEQ